MNSNLTEDPGETLRLLRPPPRVFTVTRGQNVWLGGVEALELELEPDLEEADHDPYNSAQA